MESSELIEILGRVSAPLWECVDADAVARVLAEQGVTGSRGCTSLCALARYVSEGLGRDGRDLLVTVSPSRYGYVMRVHLAGVAPLVCALPAPLVEFVEGFDSGMYPELEKSRM